MILTFGEYKITHSAGNNDWHIHKNGKWIMVYGSLRGCKAYIAKKLGLNYSDIKLLGE